MDDDAKQRLMNEIAILHRVQHPNLLHLLEAIEEIDIHLVTEYVGGGELFADIVNKAGWTRPRPRGLAQMVAAVDTCRQLVIHRDLRCAVAAPGCACPGARAPPATRARPAGASARARAAGERKRSTRTATSR